MKKNVGLFDRILRVSAGAAILSAAFWGPQTPWGYLGIIFIFTGAFGYCPLYQVLGFKTCDHKVAK